MAPKSHQPSPPSTSSPWGARMKKRKSPPPPKTSPTCSKKQEFLEIPQETFGEHQKLCDRFAKTLYFTNKLPKTPRPSLPLSKLAVDTFSKKARQDTLEFLDLEQAAEIGRNACVTPTALIMALVYLERLSLSRPDYLSSTKPSELFVVSLMVASKFLQDEGEELGIFNDEWATSSKMDLKELNKLEVEFLLAIDWNVNVKTQDYSRMLNKLEKGVSKQEGKARGWFTYSEINTLLNVNLFWPVLYHHFIQVMIAATLTYATLLATMLSTSILSPQIFSLSRHCIASMMMTPPQTNLIPPPTYQFNQSLIPLSDDDQDLMMMLMEPELEEIIQQFLKNHTHFVQPPLLARELECVATGRMKRVEEGIIFGRCANEHAKKSLPFAKLIDP